MMGSRAASTDVLSLPQLARFLHLGERTVLDLAKSSKIPGRIVDKEWRFERDEIDTWLEKQLHDEDRAEELGSITDGMRVPLRDLLSDKALVHDMRATDALGAIEELAARAYSNKWLVDKPWFVGALVERESLSSTAMEGGVAFLHTRARDTDKLRRPFIIVGRSYQGIDFGAPDSQPTYLFFLLGLKYDRLHLPILGRLARIMMRSPQTIARLRSTTSATKMLDTLMRLDAEELEHGGAAVPVRKAAAAQPVLDRKLRLRAIMRIEARRKHEARRAREEAEKLAIKEEKARIAQEKKDAIRAAKREIAEKKREAARIKREAEKARKAAIRAKLAEKRKKERERKAAIKAREVAKRKKAREKVAAQKAREKERAAKARQKTRDARAKKVAKEKAAKEKARAAKAKAATRAKEAKAKAAAKAKASKERARAAKAKAVAKAKAAKAKAAKAKAAKAKAAKVKAAKAKAAKAKAAKAKAKAKAAKGKGSSKKSTGKKAAGKKSTAKKSGNKSTGKKASKKSTGKKTGGKKSTGKKTGGKKSAKRSRKR